MNTARYCFAYLPNGLGQYKIIKVKEGEKGYIEMYYRVYYSEEEIGAEVEKMNDQYYGITKDQAARIVLSSL